MGNEGALQPKTAHSPPPRPSQIRLPLEHILSRLERQDAVFIALLDLRHISCSSCTLPHVNTLFNFSYAGHYVILTGFRREEATIEFMDPAVASCKYPIATTREGKGRDTRAAPERTLNPTRFMPPDFTSMARAFLPSVPIAAPCTMRIEVFEKARSSAGTDDDILELPWPLRLGGAAGTGDGSGQGEGAELGLGRGDRRGGPSAAREVAGPAGAGTGGP